MRLRPVLSWSGPFSTGAIGQWTSSSSKKIRRSKAAALALEGNVDAILQLGRSFPGFPCFSQARSPFPKPVRNEFGLFTATASVSVTACHAANGRQILALTESAKEIGYTPEEAAQKAAEKAASSAGDVILGKRAAGQPENPASKYTVIVSPVRSFAEAHGTGGKLQGCRSPLRFPSAVRRRKGRGGGGVRRNGGAACCRPSSGSQGVLRRVRGGERHRAGEAVKRPFHERKG